MSEEDLSPQEVYEIIMTQHWDLAACRCFICRNGRKWGYGPQRKYLADRHKYPKVRVDAEVRNL